jgi:hypothetical protein
MRGPKSPSAYRCVSVSLICLLVAVPGGLGQTRQARQAASPADSALLGSATMFLGWRGESAVLLREDNFENGRTKVSYWNLRPDSRMIRLSRADRPLNLPRGSVLVSDYSSASNEPRVVFQFDADPNEVQALERALAAWLERSDGKRQSFPQIHATLRILLGEHDVWVKKRTLGVSAGEAGYEYKPPQLRFATVSPTKSTLLVELTGSDGSEFISIAIQPKALTAHSP